MTRTVHVAALQLALGGSEQSNIARVSALVRDAAGQGAKIILPPELFEGPYFCKVEDECEFARARPLGERARDAGIGCGIARDDSDEFF